MDETRLRAEVVDHLAHGRKIIAVKRVREVRGWSLVRAKDFVEAIEANGAQAVIPGEAEAPTPPAASVQAEIEALVRDGRLIEAIKRHREFTGLGLAESKAAVEAMRDRLLGRSPPPGSAPARDRASAAPGSPERRRFADEDPGAAGGVSLGLFLFALAGVVVTGAALAYLLLGR